VTHAAASSFSYRQGPPSRLSGSTLLCVAMCVLLRAQPTDALAQQRKPSPLLKSVATMYEHRASHTATLLADGRVLIAGGFHKDADGRTQVYLRSAEIFDPATRKFSPTGDMTYTRAGHTATLLNNGMVLLAGGFAEIGHLSSAELIDPTHGRFITIGSMSMRRGGCTATLLADGRVLICGGGNREATASTEIFDPATGRFAPGGSMTAPRLAHTATRLPGGTVLIIGGSSSREDILTSAEIFDPATGRFTPAGNMAAPRYKHAAALLPGGAVAVIGGSDSQDWSGTYALVEAYDPPAGTFRRLLDLAEPRFKLPDAVAVLGDGSVLIAGGGPLIERLAPQGTSVTTVARLESPYYYASATLLNDGSVLISGGYDRDLKATNKFWLWKE
jgi:hypothetical protein